MVEKERKEEEKAKDVATTSTKEKEEEATKEERKEKEKVEVEEEVTKEDSKAKADDLEVEHPMLVYVILADSCHRPGQYEANCRRKQRDMQSGNIRQAQQDDQHSVAPSSSSTALPSSASTRATSVSSQQLPRKPNPTIRQVSMYHIGEQPETLPEQFDLDEDEEEAEINYFGRIFS